MSLRTTSGRPTARGWIIVALICAMSALAAAWLIHAEAPGADAATNEVDPALAPIPKSPPPTSTQE